MPAVCRRNVPSQRSSQTVNRVTGKCILSRFLLEMICYWVGLSLAAVDTLNLHKRKSVSFAGSSLTSELTHGVRTKRMVKKCIKLMLTLMLLNVQYFLIIRKKYTIFGIEVLAVIEEIVWWKLSVWENSYSSVYLLVLTSLTRHCWFADRKVFNIWTTVQFWGTWPNLFFWKIAQELEIVVREMLDDNYAS